MTETVPHVPAPDSIDAVFDLLTQLEPEERDVLAGLLTATFERDLRRPFTTLDLVHSVVSRMPPGFSPKEAEKNPAPPLVRRHGEPHERVGLPAPGDLGNYTLGEVVTARASRRDFAGLPIGLDTLSTLLHWTLGIKKHTAAYATSRHPVRNTPSAGGLQSFDLYLAVNNVAGLAQGIYQYDPYLHRLDLLNRGAMRRRLVEIGQYQEFLHHAGAILLLTGAFDRLSWKYGMRAYRHLLVDSGVLCQQLQLVATALRLRSVPLAGFSDDDAHRLLRLDGRRDFVTMAVALGTRTEHAHAENPHTENPHTGNAHAEEDRSGDPA